MQSEQLPPLSPFLRQRFQSIIWSCLDADLTKSAIFHAERYYAMDRTNHDARHLYATAFLREGQTYSAMYLVNGPLDEQCTGCLEIKAKCCTALGRHRQAREVLESTLRDSNYVSTGPSTVLRPPPQYPRSFVTSWLASSSSRISHPFPEEAALRCRSGTTALKGNMPEKASRSFQDALTLNPYVWEAFEGLCALGAWRRVAPPLHRLM